MNRQEESKDGKRRGTKYGKFNQEFALFHFHFYTYAFNCFLEDMKIEIFNLSLIEEVEW